MVGKYSTRHCPSVSLLPQPLGSFPSLLMIRHFHAFGPILIGSPQEGQRGHIATQLSFFGWAAAGRAPGCGCTGAEALLVCVISLFEPLSADSVFIRHYMAFYFWGTKSDCCIRSGLTSFNSNHALTLRGVYQTFLPFLMYGI